MSNAAQRDPSSAPATARGAQPARLKRPKLEGQASPGRRWLRVLKWLALSALALTAVLALTLASVFWYFGRNLPDLSRFSDIQFQQVSVVLDRHGERVGEIFEQRRTFVPYEQIPRILVDAAVAVEDEKFWTHSGLDYMGMIRAAVANFRAGRTKQGASTITQQIVKNMVLSGERSYRRKIQEVILARRLEKNFSKQEIMTLYLNQIYYGHGRYGVEEAARYYFGKSVKEVTVGEAALLAGLPQSPNNLSPHTHPEAAKNRQIHVLRRLVDTGKLERSEAQEWINQPIAVVRSPFPNTGLAPGWVELARQELIARRGAEAVPTLGATVQTTVDIALQQAAQDALDQGLRAYDARHKVGRPVRHVASDKVSLELAKLAKKLPRGGPVGRQVYEALVTRVSDEGSGKVEVDLGGAVAQLVLDGESDRRFCRPDGGKEVEVEARPSARFTPGDVLEVVVSPAKVDARLVELAPGAQGAVVILETHSRKVRALVGGYSSKTPGFNRALAARRQPGSSFKPFVYAAALATRKYTAASILNDAPEVFDLWRPQNYKKNNFEGPVRLRHALARSINTVAIRLCHDVGVEAVVDLARSMGITSELPRELSLALGSGEVTPIELTNAFASFATGGQYAPPQFFESVEGAAVAGEPPRQVLDPQVAHVALDMMRSVVEEGTAQQARKAGIPISGKTGTSNDSRDAWFVGMTPDYVISVWVGYDDNQALGAKETGGTTAVPIFVQVVKALAPKARPFVRPPGVVTATIDKATGLLAPPGAPAASSYQEVFVEGTAPTEVAPLAGETSADTLVTDEYGD
jgi:penicillin-binding protein 1A